MYLMVIILPSKAKKFVSMQHRGEIVEQAIRQSGFSITIVAKRLRKSRRWMYLMFDNPQIDIDTVLAIGTIIHHDFSEDIKELNHNRSNSFSDPEDLYNGQTKEYWKNKYLKLLEDYNELLKKVSSKK
ncbi:hypothetical protein D3C87_11160 [compost metagenome]